ncbi:DUF2085 domain-containing protein [Cytobacillus dafuensis]|uniref:DUF2085 domain-containing protein n=1 Tax=Cytobacillus dafuensis TaxID=1742359 RepID=A0A5B8ZD14_CYTDA|nr:DUF2085 domain-containing protein [Cytobacillus dafuensis]
MVPCHRKKERCLTIRGYKLPLCARCTGILVGYLFFPILIVFHLQLPIWLGLLLNMPMVLDGWTQKMNYRLSNNLLRLLTGILCGFGQSILIVGISERIISYVL